MKIRGDRSSKLGKTTLTFSGSSLLYGKGPRNASGELGQEIITWVFQIFFFSFLHVWFYCKLGMTAWNLFRKINGFIMSWNFWSWSFCMDHDWGSSVKTAKEMIKFSENRFLKSARVYGREQLRRRRRNSEKWKFSEGRDLKGKGKYLCFITFDLDRCQHLAVASLVFFK